MRLGILVVSVHGVRLHVVDFWPSFYFFIFDGGGARCQGKEGLLVLVREGGAGLEVVGVGCGWKGVAFGFGNQ
jgi:hypothetical protein